VGGWWRGKRVGKWGKKICKHPSKDVCAYFSGCFSRVLLLRIHIQIYMYIVRIFLPPPGIGKWKWEGSENKGKIWLKNLQ